MNRSQLIDAVAEKAEMSRAAAARAVEAIFDSTSGAISEAMKTGEHLALSGFGRFRTKKRPARKGRNPQTGAEIDIPERTVVQFSAGKGLQEVLAGRSPKKSSAAKKSSGAAKKSSGAAKKSSGAAKKSTGGGK